MQTCREATRSISDEIDGALPLDERLLLSIHLLLCDGCRTFGRQIRQMRDLARGYSGAPPVTLPDAVKERLALALGRARVDVDARDD